MFLLIFVFLISSGVAYGQRTAGDGATILCKDDNPDDCFIASGYPDDDRFKIPDDIEEFDFDVYPGLKQRISDVINAITLRCMPYIENNGSRDLCRFADLKNFKHVYFFKTNEPGCNDLAHEEEHISFQGACAYTRKIFFDRDDGTPGWVNIRVIEVNPDILFKKVKSTTEQAIVIVHELLHFYRDLDHRIINPIVDGLLTYFEVQKRQHNAMQKYLADFVDVVAENAQLTGHNLAIANDQIENVRSEDPEDQTLAKEMLISDREYKSLLGMQTAISLAVRIIHTPYEAHFQSGFFRVDRKAGGILHEDFPSSNLVGVDASLEVGNISRVDDVQNLIISATSLIIDSAPSGDYSCINTIAFTTS